MPKVSSSSSSYSTTTESWDSDPDLVLPEGPLTLLQSDNEFENEDSSTSSSIQSALFSSNGGHSTGLDDNHQSSSIVADCKISQKNMSNRFQDISMDSNQLGFDSEYENHLVNKNNSASSNGDEDSSRGGTLKLKIIQRQKNHLQDCFNDQQQSPRQKVASLDQSPSPSSSGHQINLIHNRNFIHHQILLSASSTEDTDETLDSISSHSSSERQSTIKASLTPISIASNTTQESSPSHTPPDQQDIHNPNLPFQPASASSSSSAAIDPRVLAVLASGAKGTVTRLESNKRPSPIQAGLDWDEDIVLPEGGLRAVILNNQIINIDPSSTGDPSDGVKKKPSYASGFSDELSGSEDHDPQVDRPVSRRQSKNRSDRNSAGRSSSNSVSQQKPPRSIPKCERVEEENDGDFGSDFELPPSGQAISLRKNLKDPSTLSKPNSFASLNGSDLDLLDDDHRPDSQKSSSASSSRPASIRHGRLPRSGSSSTSLSFFGNSSISSTNEDATPRIRTRPSLTPSLMSDRSSSPITEADDDANDGFFDDIEFPPEFGIPNNLHPTVTPTRILDPAGSGLRPSSSSSDSSNIIDAKGKRPSLGGSIDLQNYLNMKVRARATMAEQGLFPHRPSERFLPPSSSAQSFVTAPSIPPSSSSSSSATVAGPSSASLTAGSSSTSHYHQMLPSNHLEIASHHSSQSFRRKIRAYEDRSDERVEDGLEIEPNSICHEKLRSRTSSALSTASSPQPNHARLARHQSQRSSLGNHPGAGSSSNLQGALHQQHKLKRMTVPFPSSSSATHSTRPSSLHPKHSTPNEDESPKTRTSQHPRPLSVHDNATSSSSTAATSSTSYRFPVGPNPTYRPASTATTNSSARSIAISVPHRPLSVATTHSNHSARGRASPAQFIVAPSPNSLKPPRLRTKSLKHTPSSSKLDGDGSESQVEPRAAGSSSSRVQSPYGNTNSKLGSSSATQGGGRPRTLTSVPRTNSSSSMASSTGQPLLLPSNHRTLKHKKSAAALNTNVSGSLASQFRATNLNQAGSDRRSCASSPFSTTSNGSHGRSGLSRKQSMPLLNRDSHHQTIGSNSNSSGGGGKYPPGSHTSAGTSSSRPRPKSRQQQTDSGVSPPTSVASPAYADPTQASMNRQVHSSSSNLSTILGSPDQTLVTRRKSREVSRGGGATSPAPTTTIHPPNSRLTMPTIASRLKAKPSIIHEEQSRFPPTSAGTTATSNTAFSKKWTSGFSVPQQLRRPRKLRSYGDGTELDEFDDLPTSKEKEKMFTRAVKTSSSNGSSNPRPINGLSKLVPTNERKEIQSQNNGIRSSGSRSRLDIRKADGIKRRNNAMSGVSKVTTKKGLIRQMSMRTFPQATNHGEMRWNEQDARWEGNEQVLREFDNVLSSSSRPALISQLSIQSPIIKPPLSGTNETEDFDDNESRGGCSTIRYNKAQNHVVGGMIFDSESMCWRSREEDGEDELILDSDEELEIRWQADDECSNNNGISNNHTGGESGIGGSCGSLGGGSEFNCSNSNKHGGSVGGEWNEDFDEDDDDDGDGEGDLEIQGGCGGNGNRKGKKKRGKFWKDCLEAEARHRIEIKSWISMQNKESDSVRSKEKLNKKFGIGSHSYGRLSDDDRCYLQEIRELVLEDS